MEKRIEVATKKVKDLDLNSFGNPRKIKQDKKKKLKESLETLGDFGVVVIDDRNRVISANQRVKILKESDPDAEVLCKVLYGYTESELRTVNVRANTHAGEWDLDALADWTADLSLDLGLELDNKDVQDRNIKDMELIRYEKYDYVLIACRSELDYNDLVRRLGIEDKKIAITNKRKIKARAIWYDNIKCQITEKED